MSIRKQPLALGTDYCTSSITSIVGLTLNESSEEGREAVSLESRQRGITYSPPRDPSGAAHRREGPNVSCDHAIQPSATLTYQPARPAVRGGPQGESTRVLNLAPCRTGRKEGAW